uniref:EGF-like domain-containing protein n=1 Tax=Gasterosteus aculeatus aculeatus TaxID=481459 RepID=A0AAQ4RRZ7_GASAC
MPAHHVYTALTAVHISQGGEACNAVLLHGSHALYVRATQGWSRGGELKLHLRSEVFKPCVEDKDLAFCLNEGECSIIETVAGVHRHCRCKEGYHGLRCDQFVPKTDAILSDPSTRSFSICPLIR